MRFRQVIDLDNLPKLKKNRSFGKLSDSRRHITPNDCITFLLASASDGSSNARIYIKVVESLVCPMALAMSAYMPTRY